MSNLSSDVFGGDRCIIIQICFKSPRNINGTEFDKQDRKKGRAASEVVGSERPMGSEPDWRMLSAFTPSALLPSPPKEGV